MINACCELVQFILVLKAAMVNSKYYVVFVQHMIPILLCFSHYCLAKIFEKFLIIKWLKEVSRAVTGFYIYDDKNKLLYQSLPIDIPWLVTIGFRRKHEANLPLLGSPTASRKMVSEKEHEKFTNNRSST